MFETKKKLREEIEFLASSVNYWLDSWRHERIRRIRLTEENEKLKKENEELKAKYDLIKDLHENQRKTILRQNHEINQLKRQLNPKSYVNYCQADVCVTENVYLRRRVEELEDKLERIDCVLTEE